MESHEGIQVLGGVEVCVGLSDYSMKGSMRICSERYTGCTIGDLSFAPATTLDANIADYFLSGGKAEVFVALLLLSKVLYRQTLKPIVLRKSFTAIMENFSIRGFSWRFILRRRNNHGFKTSFKVLIFRINVDINLGVRL